MEQWYEMLRNDVVKLCQDNDFNTGFFECTESASAVDAYELKVICWEKRARYKITHFLEKITMISLLQKKSIYKMLSWPGISSGHILSLLFFVQMN